MGNPAADQVGAFQIAPDVIEAGVAGNFSA